MQVCEGWSPLHHACAGCLSDRVRALLIQGADECAIRGPGAASPLALAEAAASESASAACADVLALMQRAMLPWRPSRQALYPGVLNGQGLHILLVAHRLALCNFRDGPSAAKRARTAHAHSAAVPLPVLPREVWLLIVGFVVRRCEVGAVRALGFSGSACCR